MSESDLDKESQEIIAELTRPKAIVHLTARLVALARRGVHKHLYAYPELANDSYTELVIDRILECVGTAIELVTEYEISYKEGKVYAEGMHQIGKSRPVSDKPNDSNWSNSNSVINTGDNLDNSQSGPTVSRGVTSNIERDYGWTSSVPEPSGESEQRERSKRGKSNSKSKSRKSGQQRDEKGRYTDDQP